MHLFSSRVCSSFASARLPVRRAVVLVLALLPIAACAQRRNITETDLFDFHWIGDTQLLPDGKSVAFVQASVAPSHDGYQTSLYLLDLGKPGATPHLLISGSAQGNHDASPRWSPDGKHLAFLRAAEKEGKPSPAQLYLFDLTTNASPIRLSDLPKGVSAPQWSPDGTVLTVTSLTPKDQAKAKLEAAEKARATGDAAHVSDVRIINQAIYRFNGEGYLDADLVPQLYMVFLPKPDGTQDAPWQLTGGRFGVQDYLWSHKSNWIFYTSSHDEESVYDVLRHNSLYGFSVSTSATHPKELPPTSFTDDLKLEASGISLSPDAHRLAFHSSDEAHPISHQQSDLFTLDLDWSSGKPVASALHNLTGKLAYEMGSGVGGDNTAPRGGGRSSIVWSADGSHLLDVAGKDASALLVSVDANSGKVEELTAPKQAVLTFVASPDQSTLIALISNPILIGDLFAIHPNPYKGDAQTQLTHVNDALFSQLDLTMPLDLQVTPTVHAKDIHDHPIETFVQLPPGVDPAGKPKLPTILNIHGGPHSAYGWVFDHEMQWMAAKGYAVVYPNPRGSTTYGQSFANIIMNNYPGDDFHDLMDSVDAVVKDGIADPARLGVTGGSGGGLLTDWVVTQTNRFKAAVAQRDITDWAGWWYTADVAGFQQSFWPKTPPFDNVELFRSKSPITFVNNIRTPMMFILGDADYRTPPTSGGEEFFRALKYKCIPTVMVRFPRESHELSRSGEPWHRIERLENIVNWFDLYLLNHPEPQYDVAPGYTAPCAAKP
jgi:dipeptidyl aminopeptidase/acylaminoacyl peptidase